MTDPSEPSRRRSGATGLSIRLADGRRWLLAVPSVRASGPALTDPDVDRLLDRLFEQSTLAGEVATADIVEAARALLLANYDLDDDEVGDLFSFAPEDDRRPFASTVLEALFGPNDPVRSYSDWVRASLIANGVSAPGIAPGDLANVLAILVATGRTVPSSQFIDACRAAEENASLEALV